MATLAPAPASAVELIRQAVNDGDYREAGRLYATLPPAAQDRLWNKLRRHTAPSIHGSSYGALSARLRARRYRKRSGRHSMPDDQLYMARLQAIQRHILDAEAFVTAPPLSQREPLYRRRLLAEAVLRYYRDDGDGPSVPEPETVPV